MLIFCFPDHSSLLFALIWGSAFPKNLLEKYHVACAGYSLSHPSLFLPLLSSCCTLGSCGPWTFSPGLRIFHGDWPMCSRSRSESGAVTLEESLNIIRDLSTWMMCCLCWKISTAPGTLNSLGGGAECAEHKQKPPLEA